MDYNELFIEDKLPDPLSQSELYSYFEKMKSGDTKAREIIIKHNIKLVFNQVMKRFYNIPYEKKELVSIGLIGLIKSVDTFDTSKKLQFATYSTRCIDNEILMFLRKGKKYINDDSLDRPLNTDKDGNELSIEDTLSDENSDFVSDYEQKETFIIIRQLVEELPERDKEIITLHFGFINDKPLTQKEIADKLDISQSYVSRLITKILKRIKQQLRERGIVESSSDEIIKTKKEKTFRKLVKEKGNEKMARQLQSIYEYFKNYTREQVDEMLSKLTDEEKKLITLRYGEDLDNPTPSPEWTAEYQNKFYGNLLPKMKRLLSNPEHKRKPRTSKKPTQVKQPIIPTEEIKQEQSIISTEETRQKQPTNVDNDSSMSKEDYIKILELLRTPSFGQLMSVLSPKEAIIISLKLGYVDGKYFSTESIASFLEIEELEVIESTKKVLLAYKESINQFIDTAIQVATDQPVLLKRENKSHQV